MNEPVSAVAFSKIGGHPEDTMNPLVESHPAAIGRFDLSLLAEKFVDGIVVVDRQGSIRYANPAAETLFGYSANELKKERFKFPIIPGQFAEIQMAQRNKSVRTAEMYAFEIQWANETNKAEEAYLVSFRDVTDGKRTEETLKKELQNAKQRLRDIFALKDDFVIELGRRLREPITTAEESVGAVLNQGLGPLNEKQHESLQVARQNMRRLNDILDNTSDLLKNQAGRIKLERQRISVRRLIKLTLDSYQSIAGRRTLTIDCQQDADVFVDPRRIFHVFGNLFWDAVKSTKEDGTIAISVKQGESSVISIQTDGTEAVMDDGEMRPDGTGSGFAYCRAITELHRGTFSVTSKPGQGFKCVLSLPFYSFDFSLGESFRELVEFSERQGESVSLIVINSIFSRAKTVDQASRIVRANLYRGDVVLAMPPHDVVIITNANAEGAQAILSRMEKALGENMIAGVALYPIDGSDVKRLLAHATEQANPKSKD